MIEAGPKADVQQHQYRGLTPIVLWLLASNLPAEQWTAAKVVAVYKRRMQIEEGFRDVKSEHLGFDLLLTLMFM